jgi:hypothetical protein|tara:strand:+ start:104 stop:802 length:699 start_codon:yes stop_codon:yes gene_type:complete
MEAIHYLVLDRHAKGDVTKKIAQLVKCQPVTITRWRKLDYFRAEFDRQVKLYRANFDDVPLADRKERVKALQSIYEDLQERDKAMKLKVLMAIRQEVGDDKQVVEHHVSGAVGVNLPPRADSYEEWISQNTEMYKAVGEVPVPSIEAPKEKGRQAEGPWDQTTEENIPLWYTDSKGRAVLPNPYQERIERAKTWEDKDAEKVEEDQNRLKNAMRSVMEDEAMDLTRKEVPIG